MIVRLAHLAILVGLALRLAACAAHDDPRGDVVLDTGVARSLAAGQGFRSGFERGLVLVAGAEAPLPPQGHADQHPPLWPALGALAAPVAGSPFAGLRWMSVLAGLAVLLLVWRHTDRLVEGCSGAPDGLPALATAAAAVSFLAVDAGGNGSLYGLQAALVLWLVDLLARPRPGWLAPGCALGALLLLNYQCLVLLPLPLLVLGLAGRGPGDLLRGALVVVTALAVQGPWWWRNHAVFGNALHNVNDLYVLWRAGVPSSLGLEGGQAVLRFARGLGPDVLLGSARAWLAPNLLYLFAAGLLVLPGAAALAACGLGSAVIEAWRGRDRRRLGLALALLAFLAVALVWPAAKLRYWMPVLPLALTLGVAELALPPTRLRRLVAWGGILAWAALLVATRDDLLGTAEAPRPDRWWLLAVGGLLAWALPLGLQAGRRAAPGTLGLLLGSGGLLALVPLAALWLGPEPTTAYHAHPWLPDFFGQPAEEREELERRLLEELAASARQRGLQVLAGPVGLLAWPRPELRQIPGGAGGEPLELSLSALLDRGAVDGAVLLADQGRALGVEALGDPACEGRLVVVDRVVRGDLSGLLLEVRRP